MSAPGGPARPGNRPGDALPPGTDPAYPFGPREQKFFGSFFQKRTASFSSFSQDPAREGGFALLLVLWSLVLLTLLTTEVGLAGRGEATIAGNLRRAAAVQAATDGAVEEAAFHLLEPPPAGWAADGGTRTLRLPAALVSLRITDESGRVDLNGASPALLAALMASAGASATDAAALAARIVAWRSPANAAGPDAGRNAPYLSANLPYVPPGSPFESVDELGLIPGMTPPLLAALRPHLTVYSQGRFDPAFADPLVRAAARAAGATAASAPTAAPGTAAAVPGGGAPAPDAAAPITPAPAASTPAAPAGAATALRTVLVEATGVGPEGVRATRRAVLRLGLHEGSFLRVLTWEPGS